MGASTIELSTSVPAPASVSCYPFENGRRRAQACRLVRSLDHIEDIQPVSRAEEGFKRRRGGLRAAGQCDESVKILTLENAEISTVSTHVWRGRMWQGAWVGSGGG